MGSELEEEKPVSNLEIEILEMIESSSLDVPTEEPKISKSKSTITGNKIYVEKKQHESENDFSIQVQVVDLVDESQKTESSGHHDESENGISGNANVESENECSLSESECESGGTLANSIDSMNYFEKVVSEKVKKSESGILGNAANKSENEISVHINEIVINDGISENANRSENEIPVPINELDQIEISDNAQESENRLLGISNKSENEILVHVHEYEIPVHIIEDQIEILNNAQESENRLLDISNKSENEILVLHVYESEDKNEILESDQIRILDNIQEDSENQSLGNSKSNPSTENGISTRISVHLHDESDNWISDNAKPNRSKSLISVLDAHGPNPERKISLQVPNNLQSESWISVHAYELLTILTILTGFVIIIILTIIAITD